MIFSEIFSQNVFPSFFICLFFFSQVGLAIGDIESVRNNAYIRMLRSQVYIIGILQRTYLVFPRLTYFPRFNDTLERWYNVTREDMTDYPTKYINAWSR